MSKEQKILIRNPKYYFLCELLNFVFLSLIFRSLLDDEESSLGTPSDSIYSVESGQNSLFKWGFFVNDVLFLFHKTP